jgi:peptidoglycan/xylan/chitin deacetylase (PgdA/CDA1 family)
MIAPTGKRTTCSGWRAWLGAAAGSAILLPAVTLLRYDGRSAVIAASIGGGVSLVSSLALMRLRCSRRLAAVGLALVAVSAWLLAQISFPPTAWLIAAHLGAGIGMVVGKHLWVRRADRPAGFVAGTAVLLVLGFLAGAQAAALWAVLLVAGAAVASLRPASGIREPVASSTGRAIRPGATLGLILALAVSLGLSTAWVGASTPRAGWFGSAVSDGPGSNDRVALTFDDGPNATYSLEIRDILDRYGVKGTFFTVGKALDARPDLSRALLDDGQLLGDHSYHHDSTSWLDPRYREIPETQSAFARDLGVCPAFFRPPHGTHTPFMAHVAHERGMTMVTWDDSAGDWATTDGQLVAQRVLARVHPGSIILLHDSIDGNVNADRSVMLQALPLILEGLRARGLQPVRLDELLGKPGYLDHCS